MSASASTNASSKDEAEAASIISEPSDDEKILNAFSRIEPYEIEGDGIKISLDRFFDSRRVGFCMLVHIEDSTTIEIDGLRTFMFIKSVYLNKRNRETVTGDIRRWELYSEDIRKAISHPDTKYDLFCSPVREKFIIFQNQIELFIARENFSINLKLSKEHTKFILETILDIFEGWTTIAHEAVHGNHKKAARA
jgi:hypothetical protein